jgi:hypothetical protein
MAKITALSLYIINAVRLRRLVLGYSSRELSDFLEESEGYVGMIESSASSTQYPPKEWPKLAEIFNCHIHDLLPPNSDQSTGELIDKVILNLSSQSDVLLIINALITDNFFRQGKTLTTIAKHLNIDERKQLAILTDALNKLVERGTLAKHDEHFIELVKL